MRKIALLFIITAFIAGCSVKGKQAIMTPEEAKQVEQVATQVNPEKYVDTEKLQEERSGIAELKKKGIGIAKGATIGFLVQSPSLAQAIDIATSVALAKGLEKTMYKDTAAVIPIYENPNLVSKDCKFQPVLKFRNEKQKEHWNRKFYVQLYIPGALYHLKSRGVYLSEKFANINSKIIFYFVEFDNPRWIPIFREGYPFIHALADIVIDGKLAGRYVLYGNAVKIFPPLIGGDWSNAFLKYMKKYCLKFRPDLQKQAKNEAR